MAARKNKGTKDSPWPEVVRERIRKSMLANRVIEHALGNVEMTPTQLRAADIMLKKALPDLTSTALTDGAGGPLQIIIGKDDGKL